MVQKIIRKQFLFRILLIVFLLFSHINCQETRIPKNIILMISDGCGFNQMDAASCYKFGQTGKQVYESFPIRYAVCTVPLGGRYDTEKAWTDFEYIHEKVTDSASSSTAMSTGVKTHPKMLGMDPGGKHLVHLTEIIEKEGKKTGIVTDVQFCHATPAGFVVHNPSRKNYSEIAREMLESPLDVIMGCGHPCFDRNGIEKDPSKYNYKYVVDECVWEALKEGSFGEDADGDGVNDPWHLIQNRKAFISLISGPAPKRVIGIPKISGTLQQERSGDPFGDPYTVPFIKSVPTLKEMTLSALNILDDDPAGFFLMVEGGAVDWAAHNEQSGRLIEEQIGFNRTVEAVVSWVHENSSWKETLVIITADHETGFLTGSGSMPGSYHSNPIRTPVRCRGKGNMPELFWHSDDHTIALVPFFAKGAGSERFHKTANYMDQVHGKYLDNTDIGKVLKGFFNKDN
jgi:alkaline phosphatase